MATLVIGGFDPSGGAGVTADLEVLRALQEPPLAVITAVTAQNRTSFVKYEPVGPDLIRAQIETVLAQHEVRACKVGMIGSIDCCAVLLSIMKQHPKILWVIDPVLSSTSGGVLLEQNAQDILLQELFPRSALVTPNVDETNALFGACVRSAQDLEDFATNATSNGRPPLLLKGGHLSGLPVDVLAYEGVVTRFESQERHPNARGTGCRLATAIAVHLARGLGLHDSIRKARAYVTDYLVAQAQTK